MVYIIASLAPSSPLEIIFYDPFATQEQMELIRTQLGLDQPVIIQYLRWLTQLLSGNLGRSLRTNLPVFSMITERLGPTLLLTGSATLITFLVAMPLGVMSAYKPYSAWDYISSGLSFAGIALPNFFAALIFIYIFSVRLRILPISGMFDISGTRTVGVLLKHLIMPAFVLSIQQIGSLIRQCRSSMLDVLQDDYVRTARAKGLFERVVISRHALRNAWIPLVSWFGMQIPFLIGGAVITEQIFGWPGLGSLMILSINARDYPCIMGIAVVITVVVLLGNLMVDLLYARLDPRIRYN